MNERELLLKRIQACDFALNDAGLFLDANPDHQEALSYYKKEMELREEAHKAYITRFGPLSRNDYDGDPRWKWVDGPWPWQIGGEE